MNCQHKNCLWNRPQDDVITWKGFLHNWPFVRGNHQGPVDYSHTGTVMWSFAVQSCLSKSLLTLSSYSFHAFISEKFYRFRRSIAMSLSCFYVLYWIKHLNLKNKALIFPEGVEQTVKLAVISDIKVQMWHHCSWALYKIMVCTVGTSVALSHQ